MTTEVADTVWIPGAGGGEGLETTRSCRSRMSSPGPYEIVAADERRGAEEDRAVRCGRADRGRCDAAHAASSRSACSTRSPQPGAAQRTQSARDRPHGPPGCGNSRERPVASDGRRVVRQLTGPSRGVHLRRVCCWTCSLRESESDESRSPRQYSDQTVWSGVFSEAQAYRGEKVADTICIGCHGPSSMAAIPDRSSLARRSWRTGAASLSVSFSSGFGKRCRPKLLGR